MRSDRTDARPNSQALFDKVYAAAKAGDAVLLKMMADSGVRFKLHAGMHTPIMLLASQRDITAVNLLLQFAPEKDIEEMKEDVVEGFARGGHRDLVDEALGNALTLGVNTHIFAVRAKALLGYAFGGKVDLTRAPVDLGEVSEQQRDHYHQYIHEAYAKSGQDELVRVELQRLDFKVDPMPEVLESILKGYALSGNSHMINEILGELNGRDDLEKVFFEQFVMFATYYYAVGGWVDCVNDMVSRYRFVVDAMRGYGFGGHLSEFNNLLRLLTCTPDASLRLIMAGEANKKYLGRATFEALNKADYLRELMDRYSLDYDEVRRFLAQGERGMTWLLQGPQLVADGVLPAELFMHISSYVLGAAESSVTRIHTALNQRLLTNASASIRDGWQHRLFSYFRQQNINKRAELEEKCSLRGNFYRLPNKMSE